MSWMKCLLLQDHHSGYTFPSRDRATLTLSEWEGDDCLLSTSLFFLAFPFIPSCVLLFSLQKQFYGHDLKYWCAMLRGRRNKGQQQQATDALPSTEKKGSNRRLGQAGNQKISLMVKILCFKTHPSHPSSRPMNLPMELPSLPPHCLGTVFRVIPMAYWEPPHPDPWPVLLSFLLVLPAMYFLQKHQLTFSHRTVSPFRASAFPSPCCLLMPTSLPSLPPARSQSFSLNSYSLCTLLLPQGFPGGLPCHLLSLITWALLIFSPSHRNPSEVSLG